MKGRVTRLFVTPFVDAMRGLMRERGHYELERFFEEVEMKSLQRRIKKMMPDEQLVGKEQMSMF